MYIKKAQMRTWLISCVAFGNSCSGAESVWEYRLDLTFRDLVTEYNKRSLSPSLLFSFLFFSFFLSAQRLREHYIKKRNGILCACLTVTCCRIMFSLFSSFLAAKHLREHNTKIRDIKRYFCYLLFLVLPLSTSQYLESKIFWRLAAVLFLRCSIRPSGT